MSRAWGRRSASSSTRTNAPSTTSAATPASTSTIGPGPSVSPAATAGSSGMRPSSSSPTTGGSSRISAAPIAPRPRGKVESGVKYLKGNFLPGRTFVDEQDLREQLDQWQREIADARIHGTTHERPTDRFAREQSALVATAGQPCLRLEASPPRRVAEADL